MPVSLLRSSTLENLNPDVDIVGLRLYSDDYATPILRPRMEIEYDAMPPDATRQTAFRQGLAANTPDPAYDTMATSIFSGGDGSYGGAPVVRVGVDPGATACQPWRAAFQVRPLPRPRAGPDRARPAPDADRSRNPG